MATMCACFTNKYLRMFDYMKSYVLYLGNVYSECIYKCASLDLKNKGMGLE